MAAIYSVSQLALYIKQTLERDDIMRDIWISGEVANLARPGSGHSYFSLREANATLRCVMFRGGSRGAQYLANGAAVIIHGRASLYEQRGDLQIIADIAQPEGVGELQLLLEQLTLKLEREGLFDPSRKRELPRFPAKIAVVTSPSGSVWHDIQTVIHRRYPLAELALAPAPVQGADAAPLLAEALAKASEAAPDVIILARGGGSLEDLWAFNEEQVARAIYACRPPVVSAVGHETDHTIADRVADKRAPTPSAAAELVVPDRAELAAFAITCAQSLTAAIHRQAHDASEDTRQLHARLQQAVPDLDSLRMRIDDRLRTAVNLVQADLALKSERVSGLNYRLEALSPKDTLRRGYAIVQRAHDGAVVSARTQVHTGDALAITIANGALEAEVTSTGSHNDR